MGSRTKPSMVVFDVPYFMHPFSPFSTALYLRAATYLVRKRKSAYPMGVILMRRYGVRVFQPAVLHLYSRVITFTYSYTDFSQILASLNQYLIHNLAKF